jgi:hypothetical protein
MSYNVSYTTLPTLTNNSIGYTDSQLSIQQVVSGGKNWLFISSDNLPAGYYIINANVVFNDAQNAFVYITIDPTNGIANSNVLFQINSSTIQPSFQQDIPNIDQIYNGCPNYYVLAAQQMRSPHDPISAACSLSCYAKLINSTGKFTLAYYCPAANKEICACITATRIG